MKLYTITQHDAEDIQHMRNIRKDTVFPVINRGGLWYQTLTEEQLNELKTWYQAWLDFPETKIVPVPPQWLADQVDYEVAL